MPQTMTQPVFKRVNNEPLVSQSVSQFVLHWVNDSVSGSACHASDNDSASLSVSKLVSWRTLRQSLKSVSGPACHVLNRSGTYNSVPLHQSVRKQEASKIQIVRKPQMATKLLRHCTQIGQLQRTHHSPPLHPKLGCLLFSIGSLNSGTTLHWGDGGGKALFPLLEVRKALVSQL